MLNMLVKPVIKPVIFASFGEFSEKLVGAKIIGKLSIHKFRESFELRKTILVKINFEC